MEFHIPKSSDSPGFQDSFHFDSQDLADIPCPDDIYQDTESSPQEEDNELLLPPGTSREDFPDLPLPPGTSGEDLPIPLPPLQKPTSISNKFSPCLPQNKAHETTSNLLHCESENFNILPLNEGSQENYDVKSDDLQDEIPNKHIELDSSRYSPSKVDSDNENQDFITIKPKVLGKEQAKKRLMAFSLSKQPSTSIKKPSKTTTPAKTKEKSLNPSKGSNVQDQFRATISAIEEEKKKMYQNMPRHLLLEMSELTKSSHSTMSSSMQVLEKLKNKDGDSKSKDDSNKDSKKSSEKKSKRSSHKSRSRSRSKKPRRSRSKRRSQSRSKRGRSRSRRRSYSRSRRSKEKNYKTENKSAKETQSTPKKEFEDWKGFKAAGMILENEAESSKNRSDESKSRRDEHHRRSRSPRDRPEFKPIFSYLSKIKSTMTSLQAKSAEPGGTGPIFVGKTVKYTRTKPILCWTENPSRAVEFYMSRQMLLENCDEATGSILVSIMENKNSTSIGESEIPDTLRTNTRPWYPRDYHFLSPEIKKHNDLKINESLPVVKDFTNELAKEEEENENVNDEEHLMDGRPSLERKISLVNDSYLSEEDEQVKETTAGDIKAELNIDLNRLKVRSKWDSDYEGESSEKDLHKEKEAVKVSITAAGLGIPVKEKHIDDFDVAPREETPDESDTKKKTSDVPSSKVPEAESPSLKTSDINPGILASEYEEFLKMVSVDSGVEDVNQKEKTVVETKPKTEKSKVRKLEKSSEEEKKERTPKLGTTDWDQDSDREVKSINKKLQFNSTGSHDEFLILGKNEVSDIVLDKTKKKPIKKKIEKEKEKLKKKLLKKISKTKKKKFKDSDSEDSSSESYESDSDSYTDSDSSKKRKKKKKVSKTKKKSKRDSSSESESESSEDTKSKKKKPLKKKGKKKKSSSSSSSSSDDDNEEILLKQFDVKKQLMMKKIDDFDPVNDRSTKKKEKENRGKKKVKDSSEDSDSNKYVKSEKMKKGEIKAEKDKKKPKLVTKKGKLAGKGKKLKKRKSSVESDSDSESSDESVKKKKAKKSGKRKRYSSDSSDSDEKPSKTKSKSSSKLSKKSKKSVKDSSSSDSDESDDSSRDRKKTKKGQKVKTNDEKVRELTFKDDLLLEEPKIKSEERSAWESKKLWKKPEGKNRKVKEEDDWEESSSIEESEQERRTRESSWDEEEIRDRKAPIPENNTSKPEKRNVSIVPEKELNINSTDTSEPNNQLSSEALKTSLSNFSFNENSFCSFGQELSRDFFLAERSFSNSGMMTLGDSLNTTSIDPRPFQSVSGDSKMKKPAESELYSPGYSDSEPEMSKSDKGNSNSNGGSGDRDAIYDPLNCDSENSADNAMEVSNIPLPHVPDVVSNKNFENIGATSSNSEGSVLKDIPRNETDILSTKLPCGTSPGKYSFAPSDFTPVTTPQSVFSEEKTTPTKRQLMSVKGQQKLVSKAASVFQDESDEENIEPLGSKDRSSENSEVSLKEKSEEESKRKNSGKYKDEKESKKRKKESREKSRERSSERESKRRRSRSRERDSKKASSPKRRKSKTPEKVREKREIRSDSFEIEPLKGSMDSSELSGMVQPIPVLTGLETSSSEGFWSRTLVSSCEFPQTTDNLIDHAESFDIYPPEESTFRGDTHDKDNSDRDKSVEKSKDQKSKKERRKSRSRSYSPRKKHRSKSPEKRKRSRSPRKKSTSPKRRDKSPFSPRRRSPKRKSPFRKYKNSRSGDKRRKSSSRSPRNRRGSASWRSRSSSPREESPKHRDESPTKKDARYSYNDSVQKRIPVIGASSEGVELSPSAMRSYETPMGESEMYGSFYGGEYTDEFGVSNYTEEVGVNNLITVKNHDIEEGGAERPSLDQRIEMELGVQMSGSQAQSDQYQNQFSEMNSNHFTSSYNCDNTSSDNFYQNQNADFNGQYYNGHQQQSGNYSSYQQYLNSQSNQNSVLQVGNIVEVVPTSQHPLPPQIMQVGNVLQVVTSPKGSQVPSATYGPPEATPLVKTQKATAVVAPSSVIPPPNVEVALNPLIKAIQLEREKRRKEKEKRKAEREARRKARQLRREAKLMSVNEKLKKSVQDEGLMLGQEVEDEELLDGLDVPSPPIPVEIITVSSVSTLPPAGKGILITAGFMPKPPSEKKEVKFADGVCPGEGTSTSGGEDIASPPPKPKLPKEKRFRKKKTKVKKKVKVQIIRQIIQEDDDEDDLSPPPPPPGDPPLVFFAKFPFAGDAQFPVYQTQTTTTTLTTIQYPAQTFE